MARTDSSAKFWDRIAARYARRPVSDEGAYRKKLEVTREYLTPDMQVLELGCGTGSTAIAHATYVKHIHAIDVSGRMIEIAQGKADAQHVENVSFRRSSIDEFTAADGAFDDVLALSILHLVADRDAVIARVYRMLRPGGIFVSSTACIGDTMNFFKAIAGVGHFLRLLPLVKVFTTQQLEASIMSAGFRIEYQWQPGKGKAVFIVAKKGQPALT